MDQQHITESEMAVMDVLWKAKNPVSVPEVLQKLPKNKSWKYNTVATFLLRLTEKGFLTSSKKGTMNVYTPTLSRTDYKKQETSFFVKTIHNGSKQSLIAALYEDELTQEEFDQLIKLLERK